LNGLMIAVTSFMSGLSLGADLPARGILQFSCHSVK
jgi:hypothetical protein